ncbi:MAG: 8-oxo-dGTP diphosphatase MutT [Caldicoprobacterales bacterium]
MKRIKVTAGIIVDNDRVLITRRAAKESFAGGWEFPGGKIEAGEGPKECLARELKEELAIETEVGDFITLVEHDYKDISISLAAYYCNILKGQIKVSVHDSYKWVKISDLLTYDLLPADIPIAKKLIKTRGM